MNALRILGCVCALSLTGCPKVTRLELSPAGLTLTKPGESRAVAVVAKDLEGGKVENPTIVFKSSDPTIATVDGAGNISALKTGDTSVIATVDGVSTTIPVRVSLPASISCSPPTLRFERVGSEVQLEARVLDEKGREVKVPVSWGGGSPTVAQFPSGACVAGQPCPPPGEVHSKGAGETEVSAEAGGLKCSVKVTVVVPQFASLTAEKQVALKLGAAPVKLKVLARDSEGRDMDVKLTFTSTSPKVVAVDDGGMLKPVGKGSAKIVVRSGDKSATVEVKVAK